MITNSILFILLAFICYGGVVFAEYVFGKAGLYAWIAIATIVSNILAASIGPMLGLHGVTLANIPFATVFLSTQLLAVCYSEHHSKKGVYVALFSAVAFLGIMMIASYLNPEPYDSVTEHIYALFSFGSYNMCNTVASVLMFFLANLLNVFIFNKMLKKLNGKHLWLANNVATISANCLENFAFVFLGLYAFPNILLNIFPNAFDPSNLIPLSACFVVALTTCVFEFALALFDTPFMYLSKWVHENKRKDADE